MDEYEDLGTDNLGIHLVAGAAAGIMEHCAMFPIDTIKTRMQSLSSSSNQYRNVVQALRVIVSREGMMAPLYGVQAVAIGAGPAHALYFAAYEKAKDSFGRWFDIPVYSPVATGMAGTVATVIHDGFMNPFDTIKQRMQMEGSQYKSIRQCFRSVLAQEGIRAFYRSYTTQLTMNIPYQVVHFVTYEKLRHGLNPVGDYDPKTHVFAGAGAGALAAAMTTPLDVAKTLLNTQENHIGGHYITGIREAVRTIYLAHGIRGFFRGVQARILFHAPATAICWSVYEFFKHTLVQRIDDGNVLFTSSLRSEAVTAVADTPTPPSGCDVECCSDTDKSNGDAGVINGGEFQQYTRTLSSVALAAELDNRLHNQ